MSSNVKISISPEELIRAIKDMKKGEREAFLEDLLAATSPDYLESIKEARTDYKAGRVKTREKRFREALKKVNTKHGKTLEKLAG